MNSPFFSVIVPVYNSEKYLASALDSIRGQVYQDWELFLIDDGSSDSSGEICDAYSEEDDRIKVFHIPNGGMCHARNYAMKRAQGEYITFCDNDDLYSNKLLDSVAQAVANASVFPDVVCFARTLRQYGADGMVVCETIAGPSEKGEYHLRGIAENYDVISGSDAVWSKAFRRQFIEAHSLFFDESLRHGSEDILFTDQAMASADCVVTLTESLYTWLRREGHSASMSISSDTISGLSRCLKTEYKFMKDAQLNHSKPRFFNTRLVGHMVFQLINVKYKQMPSYKGEVVLYRQLRELYLPYKNDINVSALSFAYRLEYTLLMNRCYRLLYLALRLSGMMSAKKN